MWELAQSTISRTNPKIAEMHTYKFFLFSYVEFKLNTIKIEYFNNSIVHIQNLKK